MIVKCDLKILSAYMKELNFDYAIYHNVKNGKCGHVFQGRFYSSCIETEAYLISCIRYIHNNPVRAYIVSDILDYPYSSAGEYFSEKHNCISDQIFKIIKKDSQTKKNFTNFIIFLTIRNL